jgi:hypothetical protein
LSGGLINLNGHDGNSRNSVIAGGASLINAADASFIFSGNAGSAIMVSSGTDLAGVNQTHFNNQGKLRKTASSYGNESDIAVAFTNFGLVDVETGILSFSQAFTNHGRIQVHASTQLVIASRFDLLNEIDGHLSGDSSVVLFKNNEFRAQLINQGHVNPGIDDIGHLTVLGDYVQTDTGRLQIELAGLDAFDTLNVQGLVDLGGTLQINGLNGYKPNVGDSFIVMSYLGTLGSTRQVFDHIQWSGFDPALLFDVSYANNAVKLTVSQVPLPGGLVLFAGGGLMLLGACAKNSGLQPEAVFRA